MLKKKFDFLKLQCKLQLYRQYQYTRLDLKNYNHIDIYVIVKTVNPLESI